MNINKMKELWYALRAEVSMTLAMRRVQKKLDAYNSLEDHVLAGDIIIQKHIQDLILAQCATRLNHRVHRLYSFMGMFNAGKEAPPDIIIRKEMELIERALKETIDRMDAKRSVDK